MPRLGLPGLRARRRAARTENETFLLVLKVAGLVVVAGLIAGFLLVGIGGGDDDEAVTNPPIPTITDAGGGSESTEVNPPHEPDVTIAAPVVGAQTAVIKPKTSAKPKPRPRPTVVRPGGPPRFVKPGGKCADEGAFALTRRFEPLVCRNGHWVRWF
ncbi:MAG TPA: hypothetical protein VH969_33080 [Actinophytocola sp.]|jgi:hypothetical protein|uniref:hypothetical protein n=1 Tax=Actinophytocola sp. TaxID=1872138 RepID=UPI002F91F7D1